jgi:hypothetical protein
MSWGYLLNTTPKPYTERGGCPRLFLTPATAFRVVTPAKSSATARMLQSGNAKAKVRSTDG